MENGNMKVFISHSHKDKFIAEQVAEKLDKAGFDFFLDTKHVRYGDRIQNTVNENLKDSDDVLIIVTPNAQSSGWIPFEIGVAAGLEKTIIPVIYNVEKNEVPEILQDRARVELNNIDSYIEQLKERRAEKNNGSKNSTKEPIPKQDKNTSEDKPKEGIPPITVGWYVKLPSHQPPEAIRASENIGWVPGMNPYLGRSAKVLEVDQDNSAKLDVDGGKYWYAFEWLEPTAQ